MLARQVSAYGCLSERPGRSWLCSRPLEQVQFGLKKRKTSKYVSRLNFPQSVCSRCDNILSTAEATYMTDLWQDNSPQDEPTEPPVKKLKLSSAADHAPNFSALVISNDCQYIVSVTAEDKCIRVFQIEPDCQLKQLSQRFDYTICTPTNTYSN
jgi:hypothetical protein